MHNILKPVNDLSKRVHHLTTRTTHPRRVSIFRAANGDKGKLFRPRPADHRHRIIYIIIQCWISNFVYPACKRWPSSAERGGLLWTNQWKTKKAVRPIEACRDWANDVYHYGYLKSRRPLLQTPLFLYSPYWQWWPKAAVQAADWSVIQKSQPDTFLHSHSNANSPVCSAGHSLLT